VLRRVGSVLDGRHPDAEPERDAVAFVKMQQVLGNLRRRRARANPGQRFDDSHACTTLARCRGHFEPDPAGPDHDEMRAGRKTRAQQEGIVDRAQIMQARRVCAGHAQLAGRRSRAEQQAVVCDRLAVGENEGARGALNRSGGHAGTNVKAEPLVCIPLEQVCRFGFSRACENGLGQRRAFVRRVCFVADENNAAVETFVAQRLCRPSSGLSGADNDNAVDAHFGTALARRVCPSIPPMTAHSANRSGDCLNSRGCHCASS